MRDEGATVLAASTEMQEETKMSDYNAGMFVGLATGTVRPENLTGEALEGMP